MTTPLIGEIIAAERNRFGYSRRALAEQAKISHVHLAHIERNERVPGLAVLQRIAKVLGRKISDFLPPTPFIRAFVLLGVETRKAGEKIAAAASDLLGMNTCYQLRGNKVLLDMYSSSPQQISTFVLGLLGEYQEVVSETTTMFVLEQCTPDVTGPDIHPGQRTKLAMHKMAARHAKISAWYEVDVVYGKQQIIASAIDSLVQSQEVYTTSGRTDLLCRVCGENRESLKIISDVIRHLDGVCDVQEHCIIKSHEPKKILKTIEICSELMADACQDLERGSHRIASLSASDLRSAAEHLDELERDIRRLRSLVNKTGDDVDSSNQKGGLS